MPSPPPGFGTVDKRKIEIAAPIKAIGEHEATVRLRDDLVATITLKVVAGKVALLRARKRRFGSYPDRRFLRFVRAFVHRRRLSRANSQAAL